MINFTMKKSRSAIQWYLLSTEYTSVVDSRSNGDRNQDFWSHGA